MLSLRISSLSRAATAAAAQVGAPRWLSTAHGHSHGGQPCHGHGHSHSHSHGHETGAHFAHQPRPDGTFSRQSEVPNLPVPKLSVVLPTYLKTLKPLLSSAEFEASKAAVAEFEAGAGPELAKRLAEYAAKYPNWLQPAWEDMYLTGRDPLPINVNYGLAMRDLPGDQITRTAAYLYGAMLYKTAIDRQTLPVDTFKNAPLCMSQHPRLFSYARRPARGTDTIHNYGSNPGINLTGSVLQYHNEHPTHVVVVGPSGNFFKMDVLNSRGDPLPPQDLEHCLSEILELDSSLGVRENVGLLTAVDRDTWADARARLERSPDNAYVLEAIDSALLMVILEADSPSDFNELSRTYLTGDASTPRWFDKHQLIACANGKVGWNFEHAASDGTPAVAMITYAHEATKRLPTTGTGKPATLEVLMFNLQAEDKKAVQSACTFHQTAVDGLAMDFLRLEFGSNVMKQVKAGPDAFMQVSYQLASYRSLGQLVPTYESVAMRSFQHGRTETGRAVTQEALEFVKVMDDPNVPDATKAQLCRTAIQAHTAYIAACQRCEGVDRALLGWKMMVKQGEQLPAIYRDPAFTATKTWRQSTSNCGSDALDLFCFGPVVPQGIGIGYMASAADASFNISSFKATSSVQAPAYKATLDKCLHDMRDLLAKNNA